MPAGWPVAAIPSREAFLGLHADRADISMDKAGGCGEAACVMTSGAAPRAMGLGQGFGSAACVRRDGAGRLAEAAGATAARTARCRLGKSHNLAALYARDGVRHRAHAAGGGEGLSRRGSACQLGKVALDILGRSGIATAWPVDRGRCLRKSCRPQKETPITPILSSAFPRPVRPPSLPRARWPDAPAQRRFLLRAGAVDDFQNAVCAHHPSDTVWASRQGGRRSDGAFRVAIVVRAVIATHAANPRRYTQAEGLRDHPPRTFPLRHGPGN